MKYLGDKNSNLKKNSSISNQSINLSSNDISKSSFSVPQNSHKKQKNFNKEIKSLLDIAENRTKMLCKVYDSSIPTENNNSIIIRRNPNSFIKEQPKLEPNSYKNIISQNYLNSKQKKSNVNSKVKLWDELLESNGQTLNSEQWEKQFLDR